MSRSAEFSLERIVQLLEQGAFSWKIAKEGKVFYASDGAQNDRVTGQTSFAATTPTFLLRNPANSGKVCLPLLFSLNQTGTVAGGAVSVVAEIDDADVYDTGGTSETVLSSRPKSGTTPTCSLYSNPTCSSSYGVRIMGLGVGEDVSPAEGAIQEILWTPASGLDILDPGSCMKVFTWAASTGPTWFWTFKWAEFPEDYLSLV